MNLVRTIAAFAFTVFAVFAFMLVSFPAFVLGFLGLKKPMSRVIDKTARAWAKIVIALTGCSLEVQGQQHIPCGGGICFVSNHVGMFDIVLSLALIGRPFGFIAKKELSYIPLLNLWILILGGLFIDRKNIRKAIGTINQGIKRLQKGENMLIFPEGTRSRGRGLLPFRSGAVKLATHSQATIVPVAISGSYEVFEKNYRVNYAQVRVVFCPPIHTAEMKADERRHSLADRVRDVIEAALNNP